MKAYKFEIGRKYINNEYREFICTKKINNVIWLLDTHDSHPCVDYTGTKYTLTSEFILDENGCEYTSQHNACTGYEEGRREFLMHKITPLLDMLLDYEPAKCAELEKPVYQTAADLKEYINDWTDYIKQYGDKAFEINLKEEDI